jgi:NlpC/P60 family putative phage cell wall peptidase
LIPAADVVAEARRWIGTPYQHQARCHGAGVDCAGLIIEVGRALGLLDVDYHDYGQIPHQGMLRRICDTHLLRIDDVEPGCILLMGFVIGPSQEQHLGIYTDTGTIVHAYAHAGACVEHRYSSAWRSRTRQIYRYAGVA